MSALLSTIPHALTSVLAQTTADGSEVVPFVGPGIQWWAMSPLFVLLGGALFLMVASALIRRRQANGSYAFVTVTTASAAIVLSFFLWFDVKDHGPRALVGGAIGLDGFSVFVTIAICAAIALTALVADDYLRREGLDGCEFYALLLLAGVGGIVLSSANDMIVLFLGLETLSLSLYVLAASHQRRMESQESAIKYFVLGGFASAFLLYGIALVYGATGSTHFAKISEYLGSNPTVGSNDAMLLAGLALLLVGLGFKTASVPFHTWTPDVYQGAPTPATGFFASASKAAAFAGLLRVFYLTFPTHVDDWKPVVFWIAIATMVVGAILAVVQTNVKRMLAYSSISHAGYILVGVQAATAQGTASVLFYLMAYTFMTVGTFAVVTLVGRRGDAAHGLDAYRGLGRTRPVLAFLFTVLLLAQAGVPLTSGFMAKFYVISAAVESKSYTLAIVAMLSAVVAAFLYLRIIVQMYLSEADADAPKPAIPLSAGLALAVCVGFTLVVGFAPNFLIDFARHATPVLAAP